MSVLPLSSIDIGTNSTRLLIAEIKDGLLQPVRYQERITQLGLGLKETGAIRSDSLDRLRAALSDFSDVIADAGAAKPKVVATSATRDASNKDVVLEIVQSFTGTDCKIIDGKTEATLTAIGVASDYTSDRNLLIADPGGGSTEFIHFSDGKIESVRSIDIGSRRLSERFISSDPPSPGELTSLDDFIVQELQNQIEDKSTRPDILIGVGGTATSAATIASEIPHGASEGIHGQVVTLKELVRQKEMLASMTTAERREVEGLNPARADIITAGIALFAGILKHFEFDSFTVSIRDLLFGILLETEV